MIFDYGGVLCFFPTERQVNEFAALAGLDKMSFLHHYWGNRIPYDRGDLTHDEFWDDFARRAGTTYSGDQVRSLIRADIDFWLNLDHRMIDWARSLKHGNGRKIGVLSNMPRELGEHMREHCHWLRDFDHVTLSYEVRSAKPERAIYEDCLKGLGVEPAEAVFIDDRVENIHAAEAIGIRGFLFESAETFSRSMRESDDFLRFGSAPVVFE